MRFRRRRRQEPGFDLTPLMDILFIVLTFLVLTTTFEEATTFQVQLPTARSSTTEPVDLPGLVSISVTEDGVIGLGDVEVTLSELRNRLEAITTPGQLTVRLRADAAASHGVVVGVMDVVRQSGISQLSIETHTLPTAR